MIHVVLSFKLIDSKRSITSMVFLVSRSPVGSSNSNISGLLANARAIVTLCCSPPDNSDGKCSKRSPKPTNSSNCIALCLHCCLLKVPWMIMGSSTFSNADIVEIRLKVWKTKPIFLRRKLAKYRSEESVVTVEPKISMLPELG
mmetsp:Transcript_27111/g.42910  ORF Transcript_27111/g.42910 Transcript_27111/m.42910 type:complete len:144 (-) Transcript_27111:469-900(-)